MCLVRFPSEGHPLFPELRRLIADEPGGIFRQRASKRRSKDRRSSSPPDGFSSGVRRCRQSNFGKRARNFPFVR